MTAPNITPPVPIEVRDQVYGVNRPPPMPVTSRINSSWQSAGPTGNGGRLWKSLSSNHSFPLVHRKNGSIFSSRNGERENTVRDSVLEDLREDFLEGIFLICDGPSSIEVIKCNKVLISFRFLLDRGKNINRVIILSDDYSRKRMNETETIVVFVRIKLYSHRGIPRNMNLELLFSLSIFLR